MVIEALVVRSEWNDRCVYDFLSMTITPRTIFSSSVSTINICYVFCGVMYRGKVLAMINLYLYTEFYVRSYIR